MGTLKDEAINYVAPATLNISDLEVVPCNLELLDRKAKNKDGEKYKYKAIIFEEEEYRVPNVVLGNLKEILKAKPETTSFTVTKKGSGINTVYTVIPLG